MREIREMMIVVFYILTAFGAFIGALTFVFHFRMRKHHGIPREEFIRTFTDANVPCEIAKTVYDYYKDGVMFKSFGVAPDDSYEFVLHKGEEDIDDDGRFLLKQLGLILPPPYVRDRWTKKIETLRDMVQWLAWVSQNQCSNVQNVPLQKPIQED